VSWRGNIGAQQRRDVWGVAPACLIWCIWREHNQRTFEGLESSLLNLKFDFLETLYDWCSNISFLRIPLCSSLRLYVLVDNNPFPCMFFLGLCRPVLFCFVFCFILLLSFE
jgi:hypothetical protein